MSGSLADKGFRLTFRQGEGWNWRQEVSESDIDGTDMTDEEFAQAVKDSEE